MKTICFATTNADKIKNAQAVCTKAGIIVKPVTIEIDEIQGEDPEAIVRDKVKRAYEQLKSPVVVSDDSWDIRALNGFPGAYMKSINHWFKPEDFLRLMHGIEDRLITLHQFLAYFDGTVTQIFTNDILGRIADNARGKNEKSPNTTITLLDSDHGKTIAEALAQGPEAIAERYTSRHDVWHNFVDWYQQKATA